MPEIETAADADAAAWSIVLALVDADPIAHDVAAGSGARCVLCDAEPPGGAVTMTIAAHADSCPWRRAVETEQACVGRGIGPVR